MRSTGRRQTGNRVRAMRYSALLDAHDCRCMPCRPMPFIHAHRGIPRARYRSSILAEELGMTQQHRPLGTQAPIRVPPFRPYDICRTHTERCIRTRCRTRVRPHSPMGIHRSRPAVNNMPALRADPATSTARGTAGCSNRAPSPRRGRAEEADRGAVRGAIRAGQWDNRCANRQGTHADQRGGHAATDQKGAAATRTSSSLP